MIFSSVVTEAQLFACQIVLPNPASLLVFSSLCISGNDDSFSRFLRRKYVILFTWTSTNLTAQDRARCAHERAKAQLFSEASFNVIYLTQQISIDGVIGVSVSAPLVFTLRWRWQGPLLGGCGGGGRRCCGGGSGRRGRGGLRTIVTVRWASGIQLWKRAQVRVPFFDLLIT